MPLIIFYAKNFKAYNQITQQAFKLWPSFILRIKCYDKVDVEWDGYKNIAESIDFFANCDSLEMWCFSFNIKSLKSGREMLKILENRNKVTIKPYTLLNLRMSMNLFNAINRSFRKQEFDEKVISFIEHIGLNNEYAKLIKHDVEEYKTHFLDYYETDPNLDNWPELDKLNENETRTFN